MRTCFVPRVSGVRNRGTRLAGFGLLLLLCHGEARHCFEGCGRQQDGTKRQTNTQAGSAGEVRPAEAVGGNQQVSEARITLFILRRRVSSEQPSQL
jgi:hypothetical protein